MQNRIRETLKKLGVTRRELAERLGMSSPSIHQMLSSPQLKICTYEQIAQALGVPAWTLFLSDDEMRHIRDAAPVDDEPRNNADAGVNGECHPTEMSHDGHSALAHKTGMVCPICGSALVVSAPDAQ